MSVIMFDADEKESTGRLLISSCFCLKPLVWLNGHYLPCWYKENCLKRVTRCLLGFYNFSLYKLRQYLNERLLKRSAYQTNKSVSAAVIDFHCNRFHGNYSSTPKDAIRN